MTNDNDTTFSASQLRPYAEAARALVEEMRGGAELSATMDDGRTITLGAADRHYLTGVRDMLDVLTGELSESGGMMATAALAAVRARMFRVEFGDED